MSTTGSELPPGDSIARTSSRRAGLSIQSLLLIMLLLVSLLSSVVVGLIGYLNGSDFEDVLLIDTKGNVVYVRVQGCRSWNEPAHRAILLQQSGSGLYGRPRHEHPRQRRVHRLRGVPAVARRSRGMGGFPDRADGQAIGAITVELPIDSINSVMTGGSEWAARGLNLTKGESSGTKAAIAQRIVNTGNALLLQPVTTGAVQHALNSETGTLIGRSYLGDESLAASAPVQVDNLDWVIVAEIETDEAFAPVRKFTRNLVLSSTALVVVSLLSLILAQLIVRPLRRLKVAAGRIAAGEQGVQVDSGRSDERADVGTEFNHLSGSIQVKAALLDEQIAENDRPLLPPMPQAVAKRYRDGDQDIVEDHKEVTVL